MSINGKIVCYLKEEPKAAMQTLIDEGMDADLAFAVVEVLCQGKDEELFSLPEE